MANKSAFWLTDGQLDWSSGVFSDVVRTKRLVGETEAARSGANPPLVSGVPATGLSWLINGTVRGGGILPRSPLQPVIQNQGWSGFYQGGSIYQPDYGDPILILAIGGAIYRIRLDTDNSVTNLTTLYGVGLPANQPRASFEQAECFLVIQAGDVLTQPLFYDFGTQGIRPETLVQSRGFVSVNNPLNQIPPASTMDFFQQRLWYAYGRFYGAGDIVLNKTSGTPAYGYRDSVLAVTENPVCYGGDAFIVPTHAGNIRAMSHTGNLDANLGEGQMMIFTRDAVYSCSAPITREDWTNTTLNNMVIQKIALQRGGAYSDRGIVQVNEDLFFVSPPNGDIRSIQTALRYQGSWGNVALSSNEARLLRFNDRSLLSYSSGIQFDNRMLMASLPVMTPVGVAFQAVMPLDFDIITTFGSRLPPAWEGVWDLSGGPLILQMFEADFGGRERAFAVVWSLEHGAIELWEIRPDLRFENGENRVTWISEYPAYPFADPFELKRLVAGELWIDKVLGTVEIQTFYRPDGYACWFPWKPFVLCAGKDCREYSENPCESEYPLPPCYEMDGIPLTLPKPTAITCTPHVGFKPRPSTHGYQFQLKLIIKGWCRVRGAFLHTEPLTTSPYEWIVSERPHSKLGNTGTGM